MKREIFLSGRVALWPGDCLAALARLDECSVDSCVTDPPYHLTSIVKRFGSTSQSDDTQTSDRARRGADGMARLSRGFMGKQWDGGDIAFVPETWRAVFRVLKPGAHLVAFSGTRTYHRMVSAIEDAGFEIRDQIGWAFGSGFPKSHNMGDGWGTALKPAWEPVVVARKPLSESTIAANVLKWGTGALNIDGCRIASGEDLNGGAYSGAQRRRDEYSSTDTAPDAVALSRLNRGIGEFKQPLGRWPANIIHDGSEEVVGAFPERDGGRPVSENVPSKPHPNGIYGERGRVGFAGYEDGGSAARFFYTAKADQDDRLGSKHPTVKPLDLMQYLVRLVTPKGGLVLDPFAGTGTTGEAAFREGMRAVLIEREEEYQQDIRRRMALVLAGPDERRRESIKAKIKDKPQDAGPLFAGESA